MAGMRVETRVLTASVFVRQNVLLVRSPEMRDKVATRRNCRTSGSKAAVESRERMDQQPGQLWEMARQNWKKSSSTVAKASSPNTSSLPSRTIDALKKCQL